MKGASSIVCSAISRSSEDGPAVKPELSSDRWQQKERQQKFKHAVAESFGRAAVGYDQAAHFQRAVGEALLQRSWPEPGEPVASILDLGCGTGYFGSQLQQRYHGAKYLGLDLAYGMARFAQVRAQGKTREQALGEANGNANWLVADCEQLPLADHSIGIIFSNLTVQWVQSLQLLFAEAYRVLAPGGCFVFSSLLPGSLCELERAWAEVDSFQHVNRFYSLSAHEEQARQVGFKSVELQAESHCLEYDKVTQLTRELKAIGAHNVNAHRSSGLTGRQHLTQFIEAYEQFRQPNGKLPATYQVLLGVVRK